MMREADGHMPQVWSLAYQKRLHKSLRDGGLWNCRNCGGRDTLRMNERPALIWHGDPNDGERWMYVALYCNTCYITVFYGSGSEWSDDHPDLTRVTEEKQLGIPPEPTTSE